jgi:uncharacterized protein
MKEIKEFPLTEYKAKTAAPGFTGYASAWTKDAYGDRIAPGAFTQSIKDKRGRIPILLNHDTDAPVGFSTDLAEDAKGLYIDGTLAADTRNGADAYALLKLADAIDYRIGLSIGFITEEWEVADDGLNRILKKIDLWETSITLFPANRAARVDTVKSARNFEQILRDVGGCSREGAKRIVAMYHSSLLMHGVSGNPATSERDARNLRLQRHLAQFEDLRKEAQRART